MNDSGEIMKNDSEKRDESSEQSDAGSGPAGPTALVDAHRAEIAWNRALYGLGFDYWRRVNEAWSEYRRTVAQLTQQWSGQYLDAAEKMIEANTAGEASSKDGEEISTTSQQRINESKRIMKQRMRSADGRLEVE